MLLGLESNAFEVGELCCSHLGAMLFAVASRFGETAGLSSYGMRRRFSWLSLWCFRARVILVASHSLMPYKVTKNFRDMQYLSAKFLGF